MGSNTQTRVTDNVRKTVLANGLTTLIKETRTAPVAAILAHVKVGYFNEPDPLCGISHVIEHMLFKGTQNFPGRDQIAQEVRALGGATNAGTYYEDTYYYITLPASGAPRAIALLADMLQRPLIDKEELAAEVEVIIQESKQKRDNPSAVLMETLYAKTFDKHRIRRWRIGADAVLRGLRPADLNQFMSSAYAPSNIILTVVGDVQVEDTLRVIDNCWGSVAASAATVDPSDPEPPRSELRYDRITGDIKQRLFGIAYIAPEFGASDSASLMVLENVFSDGRSSRLYRSIKEELGLAGSVWASYEPFRTLGVFTLGAEVNDDDPLQAEKAIFGELYRVEAHGVKDEELERVKTRMQSRLVSAQEEVLGMARSLAWYEAAGSYKLADELPQQLSAVTDSHIREAARRLIHGGSTVLEYLPASTTAPAHSVRVIHERRMNLPDDPIPAASHGAPNTSIDEVLERGENLLFCRRDDLPLVSLHVLFPGGRRSETPDNAGITNLMLKAMLKGTTSRSAKQISEDIERLGSGIGLSHAADYFGFSMKSLANHFPEVLAILKDVLHNPTFLPAEVEKEKTSTVAAIRRQHDSMRARAFELFNKACYGGQPYGFAPHGEVEVVSRLEAGGLQEWWNSHVRAAGAVISVTGDIDGDVLSSIVLDLVPTGASERMPETVSLPLDSGEESIRIDRHQTAAVMGFPGVSLDHPDRFALDVLAELTSSQSGRFFRAVRGENSLAYAVSSSHRTRTDGGNFLTYTATSPENEERARDVILAECDRLANEPAGREELAAVKEAIKGHYLLGLQTFSAQAGEMGMYRLYRQPLDFASLYLKRISEIAPEELQSAASRYLCSGTRWLGVARGKGSG